MKENGELEAALNKLICSKILDMNIFKYASAITDVMSVVLFYSHIWFCEETERCWKEAFFEQMKEKEEKFSHLENIINYPEEYYEYINSLDFDYLSGLDNSGYIKYESEQNMSIPQLKKKLKYCSNPLERKTLERQLNKVYKARKAKKCVSEHKTEES